MQKFGMPTGFMPAVFQRRVALISLHVFRSAPRIRLLTEEELAAIGVRQNGRFIRPDEAGCVYNRLLVLPDQRRENRKSGGAVNCPQVNERLRGYLPDAVARHEGL